VHPGGGLGLDLLDTPPGTATVDELGLVEAIDGLREGIVEALTG